MLKIVLIKDLILLLKDFKFQVLLLIMFILFVISSFIGSNRMNDNQENLQNSIKESQEWITNANTSLQHLLYQGNLIFIEDIYKLPYITERPGFPNGLTTSVVNFQPFKYDINLPGKGFMKTNWSFIFGILGSLMCLLISYDVISQEKLHGTFRLTVVEGVTRFQVLISKFLSILLIMILAIIPGFVVSTFLTVALTHSFNLSIVLINICYFLLYIPYFCFFIILGILISMGKNYRNNIIITMTVWLLFIIIIPQGANILVKKIKPVKSQAKYDQEMSIAFDKVYQYWKSKAEIPGGFNSVDGNGHLENGLRARAFYESNEARSKEYNAQNEDFNRQIELTQTISSISPMELMDNITDILIDIGYYHFSNSMKQFKQRFAEVKEDIINQDKKDPKSMHLFYSMAEEDESAAHHLNKSPFSMSPYSNSERLLMLDYQTPSAGKKFKAILPYLLSLILLNAIIWIIAYFKIIHIDVR